MLEPIVRFLLKSGLSWKEFSELSKRVFVKVATADFGIKGRPTNASRVAILTGLDRRAVRELRSAPIDDQPSPAGYMTKAPQVLDAWHHQPEFIDARGKPRRLRFDGDLPNFSDLVRRFAPGLPVVAMAKQLKAAGAICESPAGHLQPLKRHYIPLDLPEEQIRLWSSTVADLAGAIGYNLTRPTNAPPLFERRAVNLPVDSRALPAFRAFLESEGQQFLEKVDDWLSSHEVNHGDAEAKMVRLGVGVYQIENRPGT